MWCTSMVNQFWLLVVMVMLRCDGVAGTTPRPRATTARRSLPSPRLPDTYTRARCHGCLSAASSRAEAIATAACLLPNHQCHPAPPMCRTATIALPTRLLCALRALPPLARPPPTARPPPKRPRRLRTPAAHPPATRLRLHRHLRALPPSARHGLAQATARRYPALPARNAPLCRIDAVRCQPP